jgi:hypothetical protein
LDISVFQGAQLIEVRLLWSVDYFRFEPDGLVGVEGRWLLRAPDSRVVERTRYALAGDAAVLMQVITQHVTGTEVAPPESFTLVFDDGTTLTVFDDSDRYESFSIHVGSRSIYV